MERDKKKHPMLSLCKPVTSGSKKGCSKKCSESLTNERRQEVYDYYWSLNEDKQHMNFTHGRDNNTNSGKGREGTQQCFTWRVTPERK